MCHRVYNYIHMTLLSTFFFLIETSPLSPRRLTRERERERERERKTAYLK